MRIMACVLVLAAVAAGCSEKKAAPVPSPVWPPELLAGKVRISPEADFVGAGGDIEVIVEANSGTAAVGAFSMQLSYNHAAFQLVSLTGAGSDLHEPAHWSESAPGSVYMAFLNQDEPNGTIRGLLKIAKLRFRALGAAGDRINLRGELLSFGDVQYPANGLSAEDLPASVERLCGVTIR